MQTGMGGGLDPTCSAKRIYKRTERSFHTDLQNVQKNQRSAFINEIDVQIPADEDEVQKPSSFYSFIHTLSKIFLCKHMLNKNGRQRLTGTYMHLLPRAYSFSEHHSCEPLLPLQ